MRSNGHDISETFFSDLKHYNNSNFKSLKAANLAAVEISPDIIKAFSSVITRYFIFAEKHPEYTPLEVRLLYFQLKIDMIARYFATYPKSDVTDLVAFQRELLCFVEKGATEDE